MAWISTPFFLILFSGIVFFAVSCVFCFMLGRLMGKLGGQDAVGEGRRSGGDRRGPHRTHAGDRQPAAVRELPEEPSQLTDEPVFERSSSA